MLKWLIKGMVKKVGIKAVLFFVMEQAVKATPSKKDDEFVEDMKNFLADY